MRRSLPVLALAAALLAQAAAAADQPFVGESAPGFDLETITGGRVALEDLASQVVVLHFGAGW